MDRKNLKKQIVELALSEFLAKGIKAVRMDDIASMQAMSKRTLYVLFPTKENLLKECMALAHNRRHQAVRAVMKKSRGDVLKTIVEILKIQVDTMTTINPAFFDDVQKYPLLFKHSKESQRHRNKQILDFFMKGVKQGVFRKDMNYPLIVENTHLQLKTIVDSRLYQRYPMHDIYRSLTLVLFRGLLTEKGYVLYDSNFPDL